MKKKVFLKNFLPLILALLGAFVFFTTYNRYLLDSSLVNLKLSLRKIEGSKSLAEAKEVKEILDAAFLMEATKDDFDLASALQIEMGAQLLERMSSEKQAKNEKYVASMTASATIDAASDIIGGLSQANQVEDAKHFIRELIVEKKKGKPFLVSKLEDLIIAVTPTRKRGELKNIRKVIAKKKKALASYSGEQLQNEYLKIAQLYLRIKDYSNSLAYINKTIDIDPQSPKALKAQFYSGILYKVKKDFKKAREVFSQIKKKLPDEWEGFSAYQEASSLYALGETEKAIALFEKNFAENPSQETSQLSQFRVGYIYLHDLEDAKAAKEAFNKLKVKAKGSNLGDYYEKKVKKDIASHYGYEGFRLLKQGYRTSNSEKYNQALRQFDLALGVSDKVDLAHSGKSLAYNLMNNSSQALEEAEKARRLSSRGIESTIVLGFIYHSLGMINEAIGEYRQAAEANPDLDICQYNLGTIYLLKKDYSHAKKYFKQAIKINPGFAQAHNNLGYVYWVERNYQKAKQSFRRAIGLGANYVDPYYNLAVVLVALGEYEKARKAFVKVEEIQTGYMKTEYYLAKIKQRLGY